MLHFCHAKINIGLFVTEKRPDGFHHIETIFYPIPLWDVLEAIPAKELSFKQSGIPITCNMEDNLVVRAYRLLEKNYGIPPVNIHLHKSIPMGAGLGGGSSNASAMLQLLCKLFNQDIAPDRLASMALELGSDCPFFLMNKPAFGHGKGEQLEEVKLSLINYYILLIYPDIHVSTAEAYAGVKPCPARYNLRQLASTSPGEWNNLVVNDFEAGVFTSHPELKAIKDMLYDSGACFASMSGSGSSVFGIFESRPQVDIPVNYQVWLFEKGNSSTYRKNIRYNNTPTTT